MPKRKILTIDRERCNGCGKCASACAEGAIEMREGKAVLVRDSYCDGLGACIGDCPAGALSIEEREADEFDERAAKEHLGGRKPATPAAPCACPSSALRTLKPEACQPSGPEVYSQLSTWPVQLMLVPAGAPFLSGADLLLAADCTAFACADFHRRFLRGRIALVGCPKLDDAGLYLEKLTDIFAGSDIRSLEVVYMQVPCCSGLTRIAREARERSGASFPMRFTRLSLDGRILESTSE